VRYVKGALGAALQGASFLALGCIAWTVTAGAIILLSALGGRSWR
jgi:hypothetical protein